MRSRITKRAEHTTTHAHRIAGLRRAARNLTGAYVAPGIFEAQAPPASRTSPTPSAPTAPRGNSLAHGSATLWTLPTSTASSTTAPGLQATGAVTRSPRRPSGVTSVPVDWSLIRRYGNI